MKVLKKNKGFTLVELIVVIAIVGILAAVLIPSIAGYVDKAKENTALQEADPLKETYGAYIIEFDTGTLPKNFDHDSNLATPALEQRFAAYAMELLKLEPGQLFDVVQNEDTGEVISGKFRASNGYVVEFSIAGDKLVLGSVAAEE